MFVSHLALPKLLVVCLLPVLLGLIRPSHAAAQVMQPMCVSGCLPNYAVSVTPDGTLAPDRTEGSSGNLAVFSVYNSGQLSDTYWLNCTATGQVTCDNVSSSSRLLASHASTSVKVWYSVGGVGTGTIRLSAEGEASDQGYYTVHVVAAPPPPPPPSVQAAPFASTVVPPVSGASARELCLTIALGSGTAIECGALRLAHQLPTLRSFATDRAPTLLYGSDQARPFPVVAADISLADTVAIPDSVELVLTVNGTERARRRWPGSFWTSRAPRRVSIGYDALATGDSTGFYSYSLEVANIYGSGRYAVTRTGQLVVVNRSGSYFGKGWWLAGLEQLNIASMTWTGGDGSLTAYQPAGTDIWVGPALDRPDTLKKIGTEYVRYLAHGLTVTFDALGRHVRTTNRLGRVTGFAYDASGRLQTVTLPIPSGAPSRRFVFAYANGAVSSVIAEATGASRTTNMIASSGWLASIQDPDNSLVQFGQDPSAAGRPVSRTDKRGTVTSFAYDPVGRLASASTPPGGGQPAIVQTYRSLASRGSGLAAPYAPVDTALVYAMLDGPRTDVADSTLLWLDGFGETRRTRNALGAITTITRGDGRWPAAVTKVEYPNGRRIGASYDGRGNLEAVTDSSRVVGGQYATTHYSWDAKWDFVTSVVQPLGDRVDLAYDATNGNRIWQQDGRGSGSRVNFRYYTSGLLRATDSPLSPPDSVEYDLLGNLSRARTPRGFWTTYSKDLLGRDTLVISPWDTALTRFTRQRRTYNAADRVLTSWSAADGAPGLPAESLLVTNSYDAAGNPLSLARRSYPDTAHIGNIATSWRYDAMGRRVAEIAPDGAVDSLTYDPAGNVVSRHTRRSHVITMTYDALNRLTKKITPAVIYADTTAFGMTFPLYPNWQGTDYRISGDTATFTYDIVGSMLTANNRDARIRHTYNVDGTLQTDSLWIRTYAELTAGGDFTTHAYGIRHEYDLDGRRSLTRVPYQLAPRFSSSWSVVHDSMTFSYDPAMGALASARDVLGDQFTFQYDLDGRMYRLNYPSGHYKQYTFDPEGLPQIIRQDRSTTGGSQATNEIRLWRDATSRQTMIEPLTGATTLRRTYQLSGLGPIRDTSEPTPGSYMDGQHDNHYMVDALGNRTQQVSFDQWYWYAGNYSLPWRGDASATTFSTFEASTGRLVTSFTTSSGNTTPPAGSLEWADWQDGVGSLVYWYDDAGNLTWKGEQYSDTVSVQGYPHTDTVKVGTASFYDAEGRLRLTDGRYIGYPNEHQDIYRRYGFEEARYDALGRRVLRRLQNAGDFEAIQRYLWDGDHLLGEIRYPGGHSQSAVDLERDTATAVGYRRYFGRVFYLRGEVLDQPVSIVRLGFTDTLGGAFRTWQPIAVAPWWDAQGSPWASQTYGVTPNCQTVGTQSSCVHEGAWPSTVAFRGQPLTMVGAGYVTGSTEWLGSLADDQRDGSGALYRRNRYYDPTSGRFTQEDPAGVAGGLNAYGFANGDPINFSDPFGLCPNCEPPVPVPNGGPDNGWKWNPDPNNSRGGSWGPKRPLKGQSQPSASPEEPNSEGGTGHWDVDDGLGHRQRYNDKGEPITAEEAHGKNADASSEPSNEGDDQSGFMNKMSKITGLTGGALVLYVVISEGSRAFPPRNLVPVP
ncbi:MAG TPA: RHS repeat-associated core domain-containing protein [Candidatus Tectomicrobia bacterium]|nr:RHS repeat-associated core domain-containing protein [Candidatus Tectomicrobia bacterium]